MERVGFEPTIGGATWFTVKPFWPLRHRSIITLYYISRSDSLICVSEGNRTLTTLTKERLERASLPRQFAARSSLLPNVASFGASANQRPTSTMRVCSHSSFNIPLLEANCSVYNCNASCLLRLNLSKSTSGRCEIRTHGPFRAGGIQSRCHRPLGQPSKSNYTLSSEDVHYFFIF